MGRERGSKGNGHIVVWTKLRVLPRTRGARYFATSDAISPNGGGDSISAVLSCFPPGSYSRISCSPGRRLLSPQSAKDEFTPVRRLKMWTVEEHGETGGVFG